MRICIPITQTYAHIPAFFPSSHETVLHLNFINIQGLHFYEDVTIFITDPQRVHDYTSLKLYLEVNFLEVSMYLLFFFFP